MPRTFSLQVCIWKYPIKKNQNHEIFHIIDNSLIPWDLKTFYNMLLKADRIFVKEKLNNVLQPFIFKSCSMHCVNYILVSTAAHL